MKDLKITSKNGQPFGIRNKRGYLLFFPKYPILDKQGRLDVTDINKSYALAEKILKALKQD